MNLPDSRRSLTVAALIGARRLTVAILFAAALAGQAASDGASISGVVTSATGGEPLRRTLVYLRRVDQTPGMMNVQVSKTAYTDAAGRFALEGVAPGKYRLSAERTGFITASYGQRSPTGSGTLMTIEAGQKVTDAAMRMTPHGVVAGRVVDEDGEPMVSANVQLLRQQYTQGKKQLTFVSGNATNDLGEYRIFGLRPGRYFVSVSSRANPMLPDPEDEYVTTYFPRTTDLAAAVPVDIVPGAQLRNIDVAMRKMRSVAVRGRVVNELAPLQANEGSQRINVMLSLRASSASSLSTRGGNVTQQGTFEIRGVTPGNYWVTAVAMGGGKTITTRTAIQVGSAPLEGISLTLRPGVPVSGKLKVDGESPASLERVRIAMAPEEFSGVQFAPLPASQLKADGSFQFEEVSSDRYSVAVTNLPDGFFVKSMRSANVDVLAGGLEVAGQSPAPIEVLLSPNAGQVTGTVVDKEQKPVMEAMVVLTPQDKARRDKQQYYRTFSTNLNGQFTFKDIPPGEYRIFAWEEVEYGAWMDPDFLKPFESRGEAVSVEESGRVTMKLNLISADSQ